MGGLTDPPGTLPTPWNTGLIEKGRVMGDFTKREVYQRQRTVVLHLQRFRSKPYSSVPGRSVMAIFCNMEVNDALSINSRFRPAGPEEPVPYRNDESDRRDHL
jgi:hypothetical protein